MSQEHVRETRTALETTAEAPALPRRRAHRRTSGESFAEHGAGGWPTYLRKRFAEGRGMPEDRRRSE